jgi:hypothetical protein
MVLQNLSLVSRNNFLAAYKAAFKEKVRHSRVSIFSRPGSEAEIKSPRLCRFEPERSWDPLLRRRPLLCARDATAEIWVTRRFIFLQLPVHDLVARLRGARESHLQVCAHGNEFLARRSTQDSSLAAHYCC